MRRVLLLAALGSLTGCGPRPGTPAATLAAYERAIASGRIDAAYALMSADYRRTHDRAAFSARFRRATSSAASIARPRPHHPHRDVALPGDPRAVLSSRSSSKTARGASPAIRSTSTRKPRPKRRCARFSARSSTTAIRRRCASCPRAIARSSPPRQCARAGRAKNAPSSPPSSPRCAPTSAIRSSLGRRRGAPAAWRAQGGAPAPRGRRVEGREPRVIEVDRRRRPPSPASWTAPSAARWSCAPTAFPTVRDPFAPRPRRSSRAAFASSRPICAATRRRRRRATAATTPPRSAPICARSPPTSRRSRVRLIGHDWGAIAAYAATALAPAALLAPVHAGGAAPARLRRSLSCPAPASQELVHGPVPAARDRRASPRRGRLRARREAVARLVARLSLRRRASSPRSSAPSPRPSTSTRCSATIARSSRRRRSSARAAGSCFAARSVPALYLHGEGRRLHRRRAAQRTRSRLLVGRAGPPHPCAGTSCTRRRPAEVNRLLLGFPRLRTKTRTALAKRCSAPHLQARGITRLRSSAGPIPDTFAPGRKSHPAARPTLAVHVCLQGFHCV